MEPAPPHLPDLVGTVFIVTYGRSGSTVLQRLLQTIPGCRFVGENHQTLYPLMLASRRAHMIVNDFPDEAPPQHHPWYGADAVNARAFTQRIVSAFVEEVLCPPPETRWYGFKEIRYIAVERDFENYLKFIRQWFPNAHFVFNSRNAEDVRQSRWWAKRNPQKVTKLLHRMDDRFATYTSQNPDHAFHTRYEDFTKDVASLEPLFDILGEPFDLALAESILTERLTH
jgi:hypothetical protein